MSSSPIPPPRLRQPAHTTVLALAALAAALLALYRSADPDFWFHLAAGRSIAEHGLPQRERWCLAGLGGPPWVSEWLFHSTLYQVHRLGGEAAVALWRSGWAAVGVALAAALALRSGAPAWSVGLLAPLALAVARARQEARPEQLFVALALGSLLVWEDARAGRKDRTVWLVPAQALWANLHPSWIFGLAIAALYALDALRGGGPRRRRAVAILIALMAASVLTPRPAETLAVPFRFLADLRGDLLTATIDELRAWSWSADRAAPYTAWLVLALLGGILGGRNAWRVSPPLVLAGAGALALALCGFRFRALAALVSWPALALAAAGAPRPAWTGRTLAALAGAAGTVWLALAPQFQPGIGRRDDFTPRRAAAVADSLNLPGPALNTFHFGGYLLWARGETRPPVVDGRGLGKRAFRATYARAHAYGSALDSLLSMWPFTHAVVEPPRSPDDRMAAQLAARPTWALLAADDAGLLFAREQALPAGATLLAYRHFTPDYDSMAARCRRALADPALALSLEAELDRARAESPRHGRASFWQGLLALARGDAARSVARLEEAERLAPALPGLALRLGLARRLAGDEAGARRALRRALHQPDDAAAARDALRSR